jgi:CheY-like chemotaxis protein
MADVSILVVEDDQLIQAMVEQALSDGGFEPAITASGEEAITLLRDKSQYRAVVTDINLIGRFDGWEVAQRVREIDPRMPIYMTGTHERNGRPRECRIASCAPSHLLQRSL